MPDFRIAIIGKGTVGAALLRQIAELDAGTPVSLIAGRDAFMAAPEGFGREELKGIAARGFGHGAERHGGGERLDAAIGSLPGTKIVVDVTAEEFGERHAAWLGRGWRVVTANKKPLSGSQEEFDRLTSSEGRYRHEATVGAGLPVISTIESLLASGDRLTAFSGMLSGTMGAIFSACDSGSTFAEAVRDAASRGFTEPDPRDDLSGMDIARKALILGRLMGLRLEMRDLEVESLVPAALDDVSVADFLGRLDVGTGSVEERLAAAREKGMRLRYLAEGGGDGIRIGVSEVGPSHPAFALDGPENLIVFRTDRYRGIPITVRGPGAGAEVTAGGVLGDIIRIIETS